MRLAVIADIHANLAALDAVIEMIDHLRVDRCLLLGDCVGYGAEPVECIRRLSRVADAGVRGNHDWMAIGSGLPSDTNLLASQAMVWTRSRLDRESRRYLTDLQACHVDVSGAVLAHGCFLNEEFHRGYTTSLTLGINLRTVACHPTWPKLALCGHTHLPMCGWLAADDREHEASLSDGTVAWPSDARAVLVNPGSVGQPRDGDPRASFAVVDTERHRVDIHRVAYDIRHAQLALQRAGLPPELGIRLEQGR